MRCLACLVAWAPLLLFASPDSASAQHPSASGSRIPTLDQLATAWSGGQTRPTCYKRGPNGEYLGPPSLNQQYCVWTPPAGASPRGDVSAHTGQGRLTLVHWNLPTNGVREADRLVDSLGSALTSRGLSARACPSHKMRSGRRATMRWGS